MRKDFFRSFIRPANAKEVSERIADFFGFTDFENKFLKKIGDANVKAFKDYKEALINCVLEIRDEECEKVMLRALDFGMYLPEEICKDTIKRFNIEFK